MASTSSMAKVNKDIHNTLIIYIIFLQTYKALSLKTHECCSNMCIVLVWFTGIKLIK